MPYKVGEQTNECFTHFQCNWCTADEEVGFRCWCSSGFPLETHCLGTAPSQSSPSCITKEFKKVVIDFIFPILKSHAYNTQNLQTTHTTNQCSAAQRDAYWGVPQ